MTGESDVSFDYVGEGISEPDYDGPVSKSVYACRTCGALVVDMTKKPHRRWHRAVGVEVPADEEAEQPAERCDSVLVRDVFECRLDAGHNGRHECAGSVGSPVRWTDAEAGAGG